MHYILHRGTCGIELEWLELHCYITGIILWASYVFMFQRPSRLDLSWWECGLSFNLSSFLFILGIVVQYLKGNVQICGIYCGPWAENPILWKPPNHTDQEWWYMRLTISSNVAMQLIYYHLHIKRVQLCITNACLLILFWFIDHLIIHSNAIITSLLRHHPCSR